VTGTVVANTLTLSTTTCRPLDRTIFFFVCEGNNSEFVIRSLAMEAKGSGAMHTGKYVYVDDIRSLVGSADAGVLTENGDVTVTRQCGPDAVALLHLAAHRHERLLARRREYLLVDVGRSRAERGVWEQRWQPSRPTVIGYSVQIEPLASWTGLMSVPVPPMWMPDAFVLPEGCRSAGRWPS
jgi:hypothetical protein